MTQSSYRPFRMIVRRNTRQIMVGNVAVGGGSPISVQTMTNTLTSNPTSPPNLLHAPISFKTYFETYFENYFTPFHFLARPAPPYY